MEELKIIGRNIVRIRKAKGMTQEDLCGAIEMDRSYISEVENGKANASITTLLKIAEALEVDISDLLQK